MNTEFLLDSIPIYAKAAGLTVAIAAIGIVLSLIIGAICTLVRSLNIPIAKQIVVAYIELSRNTPLLVQLFFLYYGLPKLGIVLSAPTCAVVGLAFLGGSYMAEALRSGFAAIATGIKEAATSLGMTKWQSLTIVQLPQAISLAVPALAANVIFLVKETSVVSVIALADLVYTAKEQIGNTYNTTEALTLLVAGYLIILVPLAIGLRALERKVRHAGFNS